MAADSDNLMEVSRSAREVERDRVWARQRAAQIMAGLRKASRQSRAPISILTGGGGFRARKSDRYFRFAAIGSLLMVVVLPFILLSAYFGLVASDQFLTETKFAIKSSKGGAMDALGGLAGSIGGKAQQESLVVKEYIISREMVEKVSTAIDLRTAFSRPEVDYISRFDKEKSIERLVKYWNRMVDVDVDDQSDIVSVYVRAFTSEDSLLISERILAVTEDLINTMYRRIVEDKLEKATTELDSAQKKLVAATERMRDLRNEAGLLDAGVAATAQTKIIANLKFELASQQQEAAQQRHHGISPEAPQAKIVQLRIESLQKEIARLEQEIGAGATGGIALDKATLAARAAALDRGRIEVEVAQEQFATASARYEAARAELAARKSYVVSFLKPTKAEEALYPRRLRNWSFFFLPLLLIWLCGFGLAILVRDHMAA